jgi:GNAT superfamily N-acetyltransferase
MDDSRTSDCDALAPNTADIVFRRWGAGDSIHELTLLLHRAYESLADQGLRFVATWQDEKITAARIAGRECFVAAHNGVLVGTITLTPPERDPTTPVDPHRFATAWYANPLVAVVGQFGVEPRFQRRGVGGRLLTEVEHRAAELGAIELALDTAEPARNLIATYTRRGYRFVEYAQWKSTNYRSVILSRRL